MVLRRCCHHRYHHGRRPFRRHRRLCLHGLELPEGRPCVWRSAEWETRKSEAPMASRAALVLVGVRVRASCEPFVVLRSLRLLMYVLLYYCNTVRSGQVRFYRNV